MIKIINRKKKNVNNDRRKSQFWENIYKKSTNYYNNAFLVWINIFKHIKNDIKTLSRKVLST